MGKKNVQFYVEIICLSKPVENLLLIVKALSAVVIKQKANNNRITTLNGQAAAATGNMGESSKFSKFRILKFKF